MREGIHVKKNTKRKHTYTKRNKYTHCHMCMYCIKTAGIDAGANAGNPVYSTIFEALDTFPK